LITFHQGYPGRSPGFIAKGCGESAARHLHRCLASAAHLTSRSSPLRGGPIATAWRSGRSCEVRGGRAGRSRPCGLNGRSDFGLPTSLRSAEFQFQRWILYLPCCARLSSAFRPILSGPLASWFRFRHGSLFSGRAPSPHAARLAWPSNCSKKSSPAARASSHLFDHGIGFRWTQRQGGLRWASPWRHALVLQPPWGLLARNRTSSCTLSSSSLVSRPLSPLGHWTMQRHRTHPARPRAVRLGDVPPGCWFDWLAEVQATHAWRAQGRDQSNLMIGLFLAFFRM